MRKILAAATILLITIGASSPAPRLDCIQGEGNIFNLHVFVSTEAASQLAPTDRIVAIASAGCVGQTEPVASSSEATAIPITVWRDNFLTPEPDGLMPGEMFQIYAMTEDGGLYPFVHRLPDQEDGIYDLAFTAIDTTTSALIDSLQAEIAAIGQAVDALEAEHQQEVDGLNNTIDQRTDQRNNARAQRDQALADLATETTRADSLQAALDDIPDAAELQAQLSAAQVRITALEAETANANARLRQVLDDVRILLTRIN